MKALDLTKALEKFKRGWVAIDEKNNKVIAHAKDFESINKLPIKGKDIVLMPASDDYYGLVT